MESKFVNYMQSQFALKHNLEEPQKSAPDCSLDTVVSVFELMKNKPLNDLSKIDRLNPDLAAMWLAHDLINERSVMFFDRHLGYLFAVKYKDQLVAISHPLSFGYNRWNLHTIDKAVAEELNPSGGWITSKVIVAKLFDFELPAPPKVAEPIKLPEILERFEPAQHRWYTGAENTKVPEKEETPPPVTTVIIVENTDHRQFNPAMASALHEAFKSNQAPQPPLPV